MSDFKQVIKKLREDRNWSQRQLSYLSKVSNTEINRIENGERQQPSIKTLQKLAEAFGIELEKLLNMAGVEISSLSSEEKKPRDLRKILEQHEIMFDGVPLSEESKEDILRIIEFDLYKRAKAMNKRKPKEGKENDK